MSSLQWDGVEVRSSCLGHNVFKATPCGFLLPVTPANKDEAIAEFRRVGTFGPYSGLWISGIADLSFLQEFPDLRYLEVVDQKRVDPRQLECLYNLRGLRIESPRTGIDFSWFPELEVFVGDWHADNRNFACCQELRTMRIWHFKPRAPDLSDLGDVARLEKLEITKTNITSLVGIEALEDLRYLQIAYAPKLTSLDSVAATDCGIREITLESVKNIASYGSLASLPYLRRLKLFKCAPMPDLNWTRGMNRLDLFSFVETTVEDGDLSPLLDLPMLRYVGTMDKKHYNYKFESINELLDKRFRSEAQNPSNT